MAGSTEAKAEIPSTRCLPQVVEQLVWAIARLDGGSPGCWKEGLSTREPIPASWEEHEDITLMHT